VEIGYTTGRSLLRLLGVLSTGLLLLIAVLGSIWLTRADTLVGSQIYQGGYALPTPTLFPTRIPSTPRPAGAELAVVSSTPGTDPGAEKPGAEAPGSEEPDAIETAMPLCEPLPDWYPYLVQGTETLYTLATYAGTNLQALLQGNCLPSVRELEAGEIIYLPPLVRPTATRAPQAPPRCAGPPASWRPITVQPSETLYTLAIRYGTTVEAIRRANCMSGDLIKAWQRLYVPPMMVVPPTPLPSITPLPIPTETATLQPTEPPKPVVPTSTATPPPPPTPVPPTETTTPMPSETPTEAPTEVPTEAPTEVPTETPTQVPVDTPTPTPTWTPSPEPAPTEAPPTPTETAVALEPTATETPIPAP
jgi:LysM repeat protein